MSGDKLFQTETEVLQYYEADKENNQVVIFENVVYDVKEYMPEHPGGADYIGNLLGKNIDDDFEEAEHTKFARKIFNDLPVRGRMKQVTQNKGKESTTASSASDSKKSTGEPTVNQTYLEEQGTGYQKTKTVQFDYNKGILRQIWEHPWTFEEYMQWVNEPKQFVNPPRDLLLFNNRYLEPLTLSPWYYIVIFWSILLLQYVPDLGKDIQKEAFIIFMGAQFFLLMEYVLHRWLFHGEYFWMIHVPHNRYFFLLHFMIHGIHHAFPQDRYRLVMPPTLGYLYIHVLFKWTTFELFVPQEIMSPWFIGFITGYLFYDLTHYFLHHSNPPESSYFKMMKLYHMQHHYKNGAEGYGITNKIWDRIFNTEIKNDYSAQIKK